MNQFSDGHLTRHEAARETERKPTLRELISKAQDDLNTFVHPDVSVVLRRLHSILKAGNLGGIINDKLVSLYYAHGSLHIRTEYEVRSCRQTGSFQFPEFVVDADNPERVIAIWAWTEEITKTRAAIASKEAEVTEMRVKLTKRISELDAMQVGTGG